ncbi:unnamed protein product [Blepharisma stoltei]|uniref:Calcium-dependent protein kinase n=1 Tax=Blepharisma stoltei TaxID=1481888 RepID=A0AAU9JXM7_9CILI|nr:unnamed protein product [Blepharisma stoltei]
MGCCDSRQEDPKADNSPKKGKLKRKRFTKNYTKNSKNKSQDDELSRKATAQTHVLKIDPSWVRENFSVIKKFQETQFGDSKLAVDKRFNCQRIIKEINKTIINPKAKDSDWNELNIILELDHPGIEKVYDIMITNDKIYFVLEYLKGDSLFTRILDHGINEQQASNYIGEILKIMQFYHSKGIVHKSIRPENIVFESKSRDALLKLKDFGESSRIFDSPYRLEFFHYMSPEMLKGDYSHAASDIWSLGVILFVMMTGKHPFPSDTPAILTQKINKGLLLSDSFFSIYSNDLKDFLTKILTIEHSRRITASEALKHPWIINNDKHNSLPGESKQAAIQLTKFHVQSMIEKAIFSYVVKQFSNFSEEKEYIKIFKSLDTNNDGSIGKEELIEGCKILSIENSSEIEKIISACDIDGDGKIEFTEFIVAATNWNTSEQIEKLRKAFKSFDKSGDGQLSVGELKVAVPGFENSQWDKFFEKADISNDGKISFEEFQRILLKESKVN